MKKSHVKLVVPATKNIVLSEAGRPSYDGKLRLVRRSEKPGRPAGTECGSSCTCS